VVDLKHSDFKIIDEAFQTGDPGYALNFSDKNLRRRPSRAGGTMGPDPGKS